MPNPEPTQSVRVYHFWTRHRLVKGVGLGGWNSSNTSRSSVGVETFETKLDFAKIHRIWSRLGRICRDLVGSRKDLDGSRRDQAESRRDLIGSQRDLGGSRRDKPKSQLIGPKR